MTSTASTRPTAAIARLVIPAALAAAVAVLVVYLIFDAAGADFEVTMSGDQSTVTAVQAGLAALLVSLVGGTVALLIARRTARPARTFATIVTVAIVLLLVGPLVGADQALTVVALEVLHLIAAAAVLLVILPRIDTDTDTTSTDA
ncbi:MULTISPECIES: DUF6069 family protein [Streptomyces]|uniref:DUF4383 domain-containing protein n=3 Tax=Streptomyces TaxID=1883 RepID=A0ABX6W0Q3_STRMQ|nr:MULTISPECIES: DUF6069 family protein [Streptomyces]AQA10688.1 hypothetical protein BV401_09550 [Streptomyces autolyticus]AUA15251.1 hypothetical protein CFP59_07435 [Streptomyces sp. M56]MCC4316060.1 DUF6069 family protein [Streptomyces malaysiensis]MCM3805058.1 DUF6069 family protein [Streptomyces sp. DR7-3]MCQ6248418.1 DUF6069 family protein [Streptomyces malaysiensis]